MIDVRLTSAGLYWRAKYTDPSGKPRCPQLGPKSKMTKAEAKRRCREIAVQFAMNPGLAEAGKSPALGPWLDRYMAQRESELAEGTRVNHDLAIRALKTFFGETTRMDKITRARVADYRAWLAKRTKGKVKEGETPRTVSEFTVIKLVAVSKQIFARALREDAIAQSPFDREKTSYPDVEHQWRYVTDDELRKILAVCPGPAWRALLALSRWGGLRTGEAMRMEWGRVDWDARTLTVIPIRKKAGTKSRLRTVPIRPELLEVLQVAYDEAPEREPRVFPTDMDLDETIKAARKIIERAGVGECWDKPFHTLRKSCETDWLGKHAVLDVTNWLGNSPEVARKHYHKVKPESIRAVTHAKDELAEARAEIERLTKALEAKEAKA